MNAMKMKRNSGSLIELEKAVNSTNDILKSTLEELISKSQNLQKKGEFELAVSMIEIQKGIHNSLVGNLSLIESITSDNVPKGKAPKKRATPRTRKNKSSRKRQTIVNYNNYEVDTSEPHDLREDFRFKRPHAFEVKGNYQEAGTWKEMLVETCRTLNSLNPKKFRAFADGKDMQWGDTFNFSRDKDSIREPVLIGDSGVYVETAKGAIGARQLIIKMLDMLNIDVKEYKVYLRADYSPKRENDDNYRRRQQ